MAGIWPERLIREGLRRLQDIAGEETLPPANIQACLAKNLLGFF